MGRKLSRRKLRGPRRRCRPSEIPKINMLRKSILRALRIQLRTNHNNNNAHVRTRAAPSLSLSFSVASRGSHPVNLNRSLSLSRLGESFWSCFFDCDFIRSVATNAKAQATRCAVSPAQKSKSHGFPQRSQ